MFNLQIAGLADDIQDMQRRIGRRFKCNAYLTTGDGTGTLIVPNMPPRTIYVRRSDTHELFTCYLPPVMPILLEDGHIEYETTEARIGYEANSDVPTVLDFLSLSGIESMGNQTPVELRLAQALSQSSSAGTIASLQLKAKSGLLVSLVDWRYIRGGITYTRFFYPDIDLTSYVPSAGQMRYATIFVKADLANIEVVTSTARAITGLALGDADVQECLTGATSGSTATWAVKLIGGQTEVTQVDIDVDAIDLRQVVNAVDRSSTVRVVTAAGAVTVTTADYTVAINKSVGAATTVNLPASPAKGLTFVIKDLKGDCNANNITLTPATGNIDGAGTYVMNVARQSRIIQYTGSEWSIIGGYL